MTGLEAAWRFFRGVPKRLIPSTRLRWQARTGSSRDSRVLESSLQGTRITIHNSHECYYFNDIGCPLNVSQFSPNPLLTLRPLIEGVLTSVVAIRQPLFVRGA
jgi:hypothetical protein